MWHSTTNHYIPVRPPLLQLTTLGPHKNHYTLALVHKHWSFHWVFFPLFYLIQKSFFVSEFYSKSSRLVDSRNQRGLVACLSRSACFEIGLAQKNGWGYHEDIIREHPCKLSVWAYLCFLPRLVAYVALWDGKDNPSMQIKSIKSLEARYFE